MSSLFFRPLAFLFFECYAPSLVTLSMQVHSGLVLHILLLVHCMVNLDGSYVVNFGLKQRCLH